MIKKIGVVSLSSGGLGESFVEHEIKIGIDRLNKLGVEIEFLPNSLKGIDFLKNNPELRADDLLLAFEDDTIDMILCAIGGEDTYRLAPYLFERDRLKNIVKQKLFLGFSDSTMNHFMLNKLGIKTFYGQAFLPDVCELSANMLAYTENYFLELIKTGKINELHPSEVWYEERKDFSKKATGVEMKSHPNTGFELLRGNPIFSGKILGGCIETIYDMFDNSRFNDTVEICSKYNLFPTLEEWKNKILLIESSQEKSKPDLYRKMILTLKDYGLFDVLAGVLVGKPQNEIYYEEYKSILLEEITNKYLPIVYNINVGHSTPRCIIPFGVEAEVNVSKQIISFSY